MANLFSMRLTLGSFLVFCVVAVSSVEWRRWGEDQILFSIKAGTLISPLEEYMRGRSNYYGMGEFVALDQDIYRSSLLDDMGNNIFKATNQIVVAMLKMDEIVASVTFNVSGMRRLTLENWFTPNRLVESAPYWIGDNGPFARFSIKGYKSYTITRSFLIHKAFYECKMDRGLMGVIERGKNMCEWTKKAPSQYPIFYYATSDDFYDNSVDFADQLVIFTKK